MGLDLSVRYRLKGCFTLKKERTACSLQTVCNEALNGVFIRHLVHSLNDGVQTTDGSSTIALEPTVIATSSSDSARRRGGPMTGTVSKGLNLNF